MYYTAKITEDKIHGGYVVEFPDLHGVVTEGDTMNEAIGNAEEALDLWLSDKLEDNKDIPAPKTHTGANFHQIIVNSATATAILIRNERGRRPMSEVADAIGTSAQSYYRLERAKSNPTIKTLEKIAKASGKRLEVSFV